MSRRLQYELFPADLPPEPPAHTNFDLTEAPPDYVCDPDLGTYCNPIEIDRRCFKLEIGTLIYWDTKKHGKRNKRGHLTRTATVVEVKPKDNSEKPNKGQLLVQVVRHSTSFRRIDGQDLNSHPIELPQNSRFVIKKESPKLQGRVYRKLKDHSP